MYYYNIYFSRLKDSLNLPYDLINIIVDYLHNGRFTIRGIIDDTVDKKIISGYTFNQYSLIYLGNNIWFRYDNNRLEYKIDILYSEFKLKKKPCHIIGYVVYDIDNNINIINDDSKIDISIQ